MTAEEKFEYWLDIAQYDLETANTMFNGGRWLYVVFMCQQAIEKLVKGLYLLYLDDNVPRIHPIRQIIDRYREQLPEPISVERYQLFDRLSAFYLEGRYPEYLKKMSSLIHRDDAKNVLAETKETFQWLLTLKPRNKP